MQNLPIYDVIPDIQLALHKHNRVVLQAPPGAGKTTAVPLALLDQAWLQNKQIIMLEPRRIAARNCATRMAWLLNEKVGETVGYQIRQDHCHSDKTRILVVTEGILTRKLQADPELINTALVIFDEYHERNLNADLSLALCLQSQQIIRDDLKVLVMSATLNTTAISELLSEQQSTGLSKQVHVIQCEGKSYPVEIFYIPPESRKDESYQSNQQQLISNLLGCTKRVIQNHDGNCLVFLPGVKEINQLNSLLKNHLQTVAIENVIVTPLHGSLNKQQQDQAIMAPPVGQRKIVLATNIAETSLTIEGINCVIDSGLERILKYNPASGMNQLITQSISQDSATQRCGRAGRLSAGTCYRLWSEQQHKRLQKHSIAEILHSDLSPLVLELANWGVQNPDELQWMDSPPESAVKQAKSLLQQLNAIDTNEKIKSHGINMLKLGTHPRLAHMMLAAANINQAYHACLIASVLTEKGIFLGNSDKSYDIHDSLKVLDQFAHYTSKNKLHNVDKQQCKRILQTANEFYSRVKKSIDKSITPRKEKIDFNLSGVLLAYAYPDRIAKQRQNNVASYLLSNGKGATIPEHLQHQLHEFLVIANLDAKQTDARIYLAAEISQAQLEEYFSDIIQQTEIIEWNESQLRVEAKQVTSLGNIILQETKITPDNPQAVHHCLLQVIKKSGLNLLKWSDKARNLQQRIEFINYQLKTNPSLVDKYEHLMLPDFSQDNLLNSLEHWFLPHLHNENSIKQCQKLDVYSLLISQLTWEQQQLINKLAPQKIAVPSGSNISLDYSDPAQVILAVRLQEVFGLYETPTLLDGHAKLMMHLLSPARRPMQVTQDLNSFWKTTYHEVKKELRGKYKRHYWPDDPFTAQATSKTKKNMNR